jgi:hypothetical protein
MAKKRGAPSKQCPHCGRTIHARSSTCKYCGKEILKKNPLRAATKGKSEFAGLLKKIKSLGGVDNVAEALKSYRQSEETVKSLGGFDKAVEIITALKQLTD